MDNIIIHINAIIETALQQRNDAEEARDAALEERDAALEERDAAQQESNALLLEVAKLKKVNSQLAVQIALAIRSGAVRVFKKVEVPKKKNYICNIM